MKLQLWQASALKRAYVLCIVTVKMSRVHYQSEVWNNYLMSLKFSCAHQGCIYLVKNTTNITVKITVFYSSVCQIKFIFDSKAEFSATIILVFSVT